MVNQAHPALLPNAAVQVTAGLSDRTAQRELRGERLDIELQGAGRGASSNCDLFATAILRLHFHRPKSQVEVLGLTPESRIFHRDLGLSQEGEFAVVGVVQHGEVDGNITRDAGQQDFLVPSSSVLLSIVLAELGESLDLLNTGLVRD